jgi:N-acetylmuramoyl-L-alanine amidase
MKLNSIVLWGVLFPIFLFVSAVNMNIAGATDSYTAVCYVGENKKGVLPVNKIDDVFWIPLRNVAAILDMKISSMGDEVAVSNNNLTVKVVRNASAAKIGSRLVSLSEIPKEIAGSLYLGEKSLNILFQRALGNNPDSFVSFRIEYDPTEFNVSDSKNKRIKEPILYSDSDVRKERTDGGPVSLSKNNPGKNEPNKTLAEISEIRWSISPQKVRVVLSCVGEKEPVLKKEKDKIIVSSATFPDDIISQAEDRIQVKEEKASLVFSGKWQNVNIIVLAKPKRVMIEFIFDDKVPLKAKTEPDVKEAEINKPVNVLENSNIVVLDPGHGGQDPGAVANGIREKDINLAIALKLESALKSKGAQVRLTRRTDVYLALAERTEMANRLNAEVFVSIHANALPRGKNAKGFEIYLMAMPTDNDALELAKFENRELVDGKTNAAASDRKTQLLLSILGDMQQNYKITESTDMAEVLYKAGNQLGLPMKRVAQAPFFVLRGAAMPAVLLETGFLTDKAEAKLLTQLDYQQKIADAMALGITNYLRGK